MWQQMIHFEAIVEILLIVFINLYLTLMIFLTLKLHHTNTPLKKQQKVFVSVIIAFRNEEMNLKIVIESLSYQKYGLSEFILINDHSADNSFELAKSLTRSDKRFKLLNLPDSLQGKKNALEYALQKASGDLILFTDADCSFGPNWIENHVLKTTNDNLEFISGAVFISSPQTFVEKLQATETAHLVGIGHALISLRNPILCNGANMGISSKLALAPIKNRIASGDDIFRLHYAKKTKKKIGYNSDPQSYTYTKAEPSITKWIIQRARWIGKSRHYSDRSSIIFTLFIGIIQISTILSLIICSPKIMLYAWGVKILSEIMFITKLSNLYKQKQNRLAILVLGIIYPFFTVIVLLYSSIATIKWKERII